MCILCKYIRFLAYCVDEVPPINSSKHPASAMMLGVVASDGKRMPPFWFPNGLKIGAKEYLGGHEDCGQSMAGSGVP